MEEMMILEMEENGTLIVYNLPLQQLNMSCRRGHEGSPSNSLLSGLLAGLGMLGILLNSTVIIGVRGNPKLTTSINHLLMWICCFCLLESSLGVAAKSLILRGTVSNVVKQSYISSVCKGFISLPFLFSNGSNIMWTLISVYRLFLVIRSVRGKPPPPKRLRTWITRFLPCLAVILAMTAAVFGTIWSEPFLLYRLCRGTCDSFNTEREYVAVFSQVIPALLFYIPAGGSYAAIFILVSRAGRSSQARPSGYSRSYAFTADPISKLTTHIDQDQNSSVLQTKPNRSQADSGEDEASSPRIQKLWSDKKPLRPQRSFDRLPNKLSWRKRSLEVKKTNTSTLRTELNCKDKCYSEAHIPMKNPLIRTVLRAQSSLDAQHFRRKADESLRCDKENSSLSLTASRRRSFLRPEDSTLTPKVQRRSLQMSNPPIPQRSSRKGSVQINSSLSSVSSKVQGDDNSIPSSPKINRRLSFSEGGEQTRGIRLKSLTTLLQPRLSTVSTASCEGVRNILAARRRQNRNMISAKLSFLFLVLMFLSGILLNVTYNQIPSLQNWSVEFRAFLNCVCFDFMFVIVSPVLLLYSSLELRKSIKKIFLNKFCWNKD